MDHDRKRESGSASNVESYTDFYIANIHLFPQNVSRINVSLLCSWNNNFKQNARNFSRPVMITRSETKHVFIYIISAKFVFSTLRCVVNTESFLTLF